jgi:hypothetical protein
LRLDSDRAMIGDIRGRKWKMADKEDVHGDRGGFTGEAADASTSESCP